MRRHRYDPATGLCSCGASKPKPPGYVRTSCARSRPTREQLRAQVREAVQNLRVERAQLGMCRECDTITEETLCPAHREKQRADGRRRQRRTGVAPRNACPCGVSGHYLIACPTDGTPPRLLCSLEGADL
jgi:hypothetical protein